MVLLRIETSADKEGDSSRAASGAGLGVVKGGAVAGFPLPTLRYVVGRSTSEATAAASPGRLELVRPLAGSGRSSGGLEFAWIAAGPAALYRLEVERRDGQIVFAALVHGEVATYRAPSWLADRTGGGPVRWRVVALSAAGRTMRSSEWRSLDLATGDPQHAQAK
jgi:hypothetical protein